MAFSFPASPALRLRLIAALSFILAAIAVPGALLVSERILSREFARSQALRENVYESFRRRSQLQTVLSQLQDIEIGQRGYVLTHDEKFLEPQLRVRSRVEGELSSLDRSLRTEADHGPKLDSLRLLVARKLAFVDHSIALERAGRGVEAARMIAGGADRRTMDAIRRIIADFDQAEGTQLAHMVELSNAATLHGRRVRLGINLLLVLMLMAAIWMISRAMASRRRALVHVEDLSARQRAILEGARDGIVMLDTDGTIEHLNAAAAHMYGYEPDELRGRDVGLLFEMDSGDQAESFRTRRRPGGAKLDLVHELWGQRRDGRPFPIDVSISPIRLEDGTRYVAIIRDVSERKQMEQLTSDFVSIVSHELRTPLTSIGGSLGLIAGGAVGHIPDRAMRLIEIAHSNADRLVRLINDILDIDKIESGAVRFDIKPTRLKPVIEQAVDSNRGFAAEHDVTLIFDGCRDDACALIDADGLTQVITNLLANAAKFSPEGKPVRLSVTPLDRRYRITVADRGAGIPEEFRPRIFDKFAQADSSDARGKGGTGLGLSIAREIVDRLGGAIWFEDRPGGGTLFHVDLPAASPTDVAASRPAAREEGGPPLILHVDDDPMIRRLVAKAFQEAEIEYAPTLAAARSLLAQRCFSLAILDITLPDGSGLALIPELHAPDCRVPVILFSAKDLEQPATSEAEAIIPKSQATIDKLVETAATLLGSALGRKAA